MTTIEAARTDIRRYLNIRSAYNPRFSSGGKHLLFLMNTTGVPQVWRVPVEGGWPDQITFYDEAVRSIHCPHAGPAERFIFAMDRGGSERTQLYLASNLGSNVIDISRHPDAIHDWGGWSPNGRHIAFSANRVDKSQFDVYVQEVSGDGKSEARLVRKGPGGYFNAGEFSPDGSKLLVLHYPANSNQFVHVLDVASGEDRNLTPHEGETRYLSPKWSSDGQGIYVLTDYHGDFLSLARIDLATGSLEFVERPAWDVESFEVCRNSQCIAWVVNEGGLSRLYVKKIGSDEPAARVELPMGVVEHLEFSPDGRQLAFSLNGPQHNYNVWVHRRHQAGAAHENASQITHASRAGVSHAAFVKPELIHYASFDGLKIPAWLYMPPDDVSSNSRRPPVVVYPHGGPESQSRPTFNSVFAYLLNRGYAIFAPNVRGSSGYGTRFMNLDNVRKRMDSVSDLAHGAYWLRDSGRIDGKRMAVYGGSYGGFMVLAAITKYPDLYAAAIDVVGIANFVTFLENTGAYRRAAREAEYGSLETDRDFLDSISPIHDVDRIKTPLMVIHGANDPRVPVGEAEQIVAALRQRAVPVEYLRYDDEGHGLIKLSNRLDAYPKMADFLDRYLTAKP